MRCTKRQSQLASAHLLSCHPEEHSDEESAVTLHFRTVEPYSIAGCPMTTLKQEADPRAEKGGMGA